MQRFMKRWHNKNTAGCGQKEGEAEETKEKKEKEEKEDGEQKMEEETEGQESGESSGEEYLRNVGEAVAQSTYMYI